MPHQHATKTPTNTPPKRPTNTPPKRPPTRPTNTPHQHPTNTPTYITIARHSNRQLEGRLVRLQDRDVRLQVQAFVG